MRVYLVRRGIKFSSVKLGTKTTRCNSTRGGRKNSSDMDKAIADHKLKTFVLDVVNAEDKEADGSTDHFYRSYPEFFPTKDRDIELVSPGFRRKWTTPEQVHREVSQIYYRYVISELRDGLRQIWNAEDQHTAEWHLFNLQLALHRVVDARDDVWADKYLEPPPANAPLYQAIDCVRRNLHHLRVCRNLAPPLTPPETRELYCATPYFLHVREQYCSERCRAAGQKKHKVTWWNKNKAKGKSKETREAVILPKNGETKQQDMLEATGTDRRRFKNFLEHVANIGEDPAAAKRVFSQYQDFLPSTSEEDLKTFLPMIANRLKSKRGEEAYRHAVVEELRDRLHNIWCAEDHHTAKWRIFTLRLKLESIMGRQRSGGRPRGVESVSRVFRYLQTRVDFLRRCANPDCQITPFFIADRQKRIRCSRECGSVAQSKFKKDWWKTKGPLWRKAKRSQRKKSQKRVRKTR